MLDLLPLSEETKEKLLETLRGVCRELSQHNDLYATTFRLYFEELGKILNNSEGLDIQALIDEAGLLMGVISEHLLSREIVYEMVDDDVELE
jgi:hypothetical protein